MNIREWMDMAEKMSIKELKKNIDAMGQIQFGIADELYIKPVRDLFCVVYEKRIAKLICKNCGRDGEHHSADQFSCYLPLKDKIKAGTTRENAVKFEVE